MTSDDEPRTVSDVLAERVRRYRESAGLRQDDLAARTAELGHPMSRVTLAKLEAGGTRATRATLVDVLVLAAALNVPPPLLFLPLGEAEAVAIAPELVAHPHLVLDWLAADEPLAALPDNFVVGNMEAWQRNAYPVRMFRGLRERQDEAWLADAQVRGIEAQGNEAIAAEARHRLDRALSSLAAWCESMRTAGMTVPVMPDAWQARMAELGES